MSRAVRASTARRGSQAGGTRKSHRGSASSVRTLRFATLPIVAVAALLLFEITTWDRIAPGVRALGVPVGGISQAEAAARLAPGVQQVLDQPLELRSGPQSWHTTARDLGLRLDPIELAAAAYSVGRSGNPVERLADQFDALVRGRSLSPANTTDQVALDASIKNIARQIERAPRDARLALAADGGLEAANAEDGLAVDIAASRAEVTAALSSGHQSVELVTRSIPPAIADAQVQGARDQLERLLGAGSQPFTVTFGDQSWQLDRADVLKIVTLEGGKQPGQPASLKVDDAPLQAWVTRLGKEIDQTVQDARFQFSGGNLKVLRPSRQGRKLDQAAAIKQLHAALLGDQGSLQLPVETVEPKVSSDNPQALGISEVIERGNTSFAGSIPEKKANIKLAASRINGTVVAPGETFSFNDAVGPTTLDAGFQWGFAIESGRNGPKTVPSVAGGICQVATTLFQPVFWAGYQLEERYWHLYWIPAYTSRGVVGLDVTVDADSGLDFRWTNTTSNYILIQADTDDERVYFGLYGKKPSWKVEVDDAIISNRTPPDTKPLAQEEPSLPWGKTLMVETARDGFDAQVVRRVIPSDGGKPRELTLKSTYQPAHTVTLVGTAGKPAGANVGDVIQRVLDAQKPAEARPTASPAAAASPAANATPGTPATAATAASEATPAPKPSGTQPPVLNAPAAATTKPAELAPTARPQAAQTPPSTAKPAEPTPRPQATPTR